MKKNSGLMVLICSALAFAIVAPNLISANADDEKKPTAKKGKDKATKTAKGKARNRLPAQYGKLNLSGEQRDKIYAVQAKYRSEFAELQKQFRELRAKQDGEIQAVLSDNQKKELDELLSQAKKARSDRAKKQGATKKTSKKQTDKKPTDKKQ